MANVALVVDRDESRRAAYAAAVRAAVALVPGLVQGEAGGGPLVVVWATGVHTPVSVVSDGTGGAVLWGEAIVGPGSMRATATEVRAEWGGSGPAAVWDGFYAAVQWDKAGVVTVGADLLGIFPLYWWSDGEVVLVGTSPELFRWHPRFRGRLDPAGLVGVLLTNGLVGGRTLWSDVRRLDPGHVLRGGLRAGVREEAQYELPLSGRHLDLPFRGQVEVLGEVLKDAVARHAPPGQAYGMLLSGGLDSRMLAGFLTDDGVLPRALTLGLPTDLEMRCAKGVARALGLEHVSAEPDPGLYPRYASLQASWEHLANGFNTIRDWESQAHVGRLAPRFVTGGLADAVVGGTSICWAYSRAAAAMTFDAFLSQMPKLGVSPEVLDVLLAHDVFRGIVRDTLSQLERDFTESGDSASRRAWCYDLKHGQRFHVGGTVWRLSFGAWPVVPMLDRRVLEMAASLPAAALADRMAQISLLQTRFPRLAELPLDRSDLALDEPQLLSPRLRHLVRQYLRSRFDKVRRAMRATEVRYWYRINNLDGEGWRAVRALAEPGRERVQHLLDPSVLDSILPAPGLPSVRPALRVQESGRKLLIGFLIWAQSHL